MKIDNEYFSFNKLLWDTENLNLNVFELLLKKDLNLNQFKQLNFIFDIKGLIFIKNATLNRENSKWIGLNLNAILYDTNVFFEYDIKNEEEIVHNEYNYKICSSLEDDISDFASYNYSRFYKDSDLRDRSKNDIYSEWVNNARLIDNKKFIKIEFQNNVLGYVLYSIKQSDYSIELISIKNKYQNMKLGTRLIDFLKKEAFNHNVSKIYVGTQISNINAINFYIKNGFYVASTTDIYHLWNKYV